MTRLQAKLTGTSIGSSPGNSEPISDKYLRYQSDESLQSHVVVLPPRWLLRHVKT
jgi:hypothetical protein